jgi:hypothetical protein
MTRGALGAPRGCRGGGGGARRGAGAAPPPAVAAAAAATRENIARDSRWWRARVGL